MEFLFVIRMRNTFSCLVIFFKVGFQRTNELASDDCIGGVCRIIFLIGLTVLFILNPQAREELNNLSLASYNISGMNAQTWAAVIVYGGTGLLNIIFCIGLFRDRPHSPVSLTGKILLMNMCCYLVDFWSVTL